MKKKVFPRELIGTALNIHSALCDYRNGKADLKTTKERLGTYRGFADARVNSMGYDKIKQELLKLHGR